MSSQRIYNWARKHPDKIAVVHNGVPRSYAALAGAIHSTRQYLRAYHLPPGKTAIVVVSHLLDCHIVCMALQGLGLNTICVKSAELLPELALTHIACVAGTAADIGRHENGPEQWGSDSILTIPNPDYGNVVATGLPLRDTHLPQGGHIVYTSGTTGTYKKLFFSGEQQEQRDAERTLSHNYSTGTIYHCGNFGLWTGIGYKIPQTTWYAGGCVILDQRSDWPEFFLRSGMTNAVLIPGMVNELLTFIDKLSAEPTPSDFRLMVSGGFISRRSAAQLLKHVTTNLENVCASTESNLPALRAMTRNLDELHWLSPIRERTVEIVDEFDNICPTGVEGHFRIGLTELDCNAYLDNPTATQKAFRNGCFYPGDMAVRREDGRIRILGRSADVINLRGQKAAVAPIEYKIQTRLGVDSVCIFSGISDADEEEIVIAIESQTPPAKSDLMNLGHEFAEFDQVRFALLQNFPRTKTGTHKIDRISLRKLVFPSERTAKTNQEE